MTGTALYEQQRIPAGIMRGFFTPASKPSAAGSKRKGKTRQTDKQAALSGGLFVRLFRFLRQYATPQKIIFPAGLPQQAQTSLSFSCSKGRQREDMPASSFIFCSHATSPHHMVLIKPPFSS